MKTFTILRDICSVAAGGLGAALINQVIFCTYRHGTNGPRCQIEDVAMIAIYTAGLLLVVLIALFNYLYEHRNTNSQAGPSEF